jgi:hypothetical protein
MLQGWHGGGDGVGDEDLVLEPGEAAEFSTWTPHGLSGPAEVLTLMGHHGERAHLRVTPE